MKFFQTLMVGSVLATRNFWFADASTTQTYVNNGAAEWDLTSTESVPSSSDAYCGTDPCKPNLFSSDKQPIIIQSSNAYMEIQYSGYSVDKTSTYTLYLTIDISGVTATMRYGNDPIFAIPVTQEAGLYYINPDLTFAPSFDPTVHPSVMPSVSSNPSVMPSIKPSVAPTVRPTAPSHEPTSQPSASPSVEPTSRPSTELYSVPKGVSYDVKMLHDALIALMAIGGFLVVCGFMAGDYESSESGDEYSHIDGDDAAVAKRDRKSGLTCITLGSIGISLLLGSGIAYAVLCAGFSENYAKVNYGNKTGVDCTIDPSSVSDKSVEFSSYNWVTNSELTIGIPSNGDGWINFEANCGGDIVKTSFIGKPSSADNYINNANFRLGYDISQDNVGYYELIDNEGAPPSYSAPKYPKELMDGLMYGMIAGGGCLVAAVLISCSLKKDNSDSWNYLPLLKTGGYNVSLRDCKGYACLILVPAGILALVACGAAYNQEQIKYNKQKYSKVEYGNDTGDVCTIIKVQGYARPSSYNWQPGTAISLEFNGGDWFTLDMHCVDTNSTEHDVSTTIVNHKSSTYNKVESDPAYGLKLDIIVRELPEKAAKATAYYRLTKNDGEAGMSKLAFWSSNHSSLGEEPEYITLPGLNRK